MTFQLEYLHVTVTHYKVKVMSILTANKMVKDMANITIAINYKSHVGYRLAYLDSTYSILKVKIMNISTLSISKMVTEI